MCVNYLVVLQDARSVSGQADTWMDAVAECRRIAEPGGWHTRGTCVIRFVLSDGTRHEDRTDLAMLADDAARFDEQILRIEHSMREALGSQGRSHK